MSETVRELVERMVAAGEWPEPDLLQAIVDKGAEAVEPLLDVIRREPHGWPEEAPMYHSMGLLTHLPRSQAVVDVLPPLFRRYEGDALEICQDVLPPYGPVVIDPLLDVIRDHTLDWYTIAVACNIVLKATFDHPEPFARVKDFLRDQLALLVAKGKKCSGNEYMIACSLVLDLSYTADPALRPLLEEALRMGFTEMMDERALEDRYRRGPERPWGSMGNWLEWYRDAWKRHKKAEQKRNEPPQPVPPPAWSPKPPPEPPVPVTKPLTSSLKIGRNEPCWCGSGKKYKHCHLHSDQQ
jgi:hypothetical protein